MIGMLTVDRLQRCERAVREQLLNSRTEHGHWTGKLSTSALSTATAVMALQQVRLQQEGSFQYDSLIDGGLAWLAAHQNDDGGWGDTVLSLSNISTTMLAHAVFHATGTVEKFASNMEKAKRYIDEIGGVDAVIKRYGKDKTFSVPILTHCALAGLVDWGMVSPLPFEMSCLPHRFYAAIRLPVVSYALPALIAIGQVRHHFKRSWIPGVALIRDAAIAKSLRVLESIQPGNGGFLEATPLTSFVTMSLAAKGLADHPVVKKGVEFIVDSVLEDGSWPIDTNLATWTTTLAVNALSTGGRNENGLNGSSDIEERPLNAVERKRLTDWLLGQQYREVHPFTNAAPGGWAWTDLPGGVPDADDTPGAMLALMNLSDDGDATSSENSPAVVESLLAGAGWLLDLQNRDGGWPTFCRGWGTLPFDRSSADITAHCLRALHRVREIASPTMAKRIDSSTNEGFAYLEKKQRSDGSWLPLWFGNQHAPEEENPVYGTSKVLAAYRDTGRMGREAAIHALSWIQEHQNEDGGWGGLRGIESSVEETALATEVLMLSDEASGAVSAGLDWLCSRIEAGKIGEPCPIGFYFAKLWYFEELYPVVFALGTLRRTAQREPFGEKSAVTTLP